MTKDGKSCSKSGKESWAAGAADRALLPCVTPDGFHPTLILLVPIRTTFSPTFSPAFISTFNDQRLTHQRESGQDKGSCVLNIIKQ